MISDEGNPKPQKFRISRLGLGFGAFSMLQGLCLDCLGFGSLGIKLQRGKPKLGVIPSSDIGFRG